jgi:hypothetical protein
MSNDTAWAEACALYRMLGDENTVEELRELIAMPLKIEQHLRTFARKNPAEAHWIESSIKFRQAERLVWEGVAVAEMSEVEKSKLDAIEATYANAQP